MPKKIYLIAISSITLVFAFFVTWSVIAPQKQIPLALASHTPDYCDSRTNIASCVGDLVGQASAQTVSSCREYCSNIISHSIPSNGCWLLSPAPGNNCYCRTNTNGTINSGGPNQGGSCPAGSSPPPPTISFFFADPNPIPAEGSGTTLTWDSTNTTSCNTSWSVSNSVSNSEWVSPSSTSTTYTLSCTGPGGTTPTSSVTVTKNSPPPPPPTITTFYAQPASIEAGDPSTLSWSSNNATSCTASGAWSGSKSTSGSQPVSPSSTSIYTLFCTGPGGTTPTSSVTVTVTQPSSSSCSSDTINLSIVPSSGPSGTTSNLDVSGLFNCNGKRVSFQREGCTSGEITFCPISGGGCSANVTSTGAQEQVITYYACVDKNGDGGFGVGESANKSFTVTNQSPADCPAATYTWSKDGNTCSVPQQPLIPNGSFINVKDESGPLTGSERVDCADGDTTESLQLCGEARSTSPCAGKVILYQDNTPSPFCKGYNTDDSNFEDDQFASTPETNGGNVNDRASYIAINDNSCTATLYTEDHFNENVPGKSFTTASSAPLDSTSVGSEASSIKIECDGDDGGTLTPEEPNKYNNPTGEVDTLEKLLGGVTGWLLLLSVPLLSLMVLYGGFLIMTSGGQEERYGKGMKTLRWGVIGFIVIILSGAIAALVRTILG